MFKNPVPVSVGIIPGTVPGSLIFVERADGGIALPGGYVDEGENSSIAVNREVEEEVGLFLEKEKWQVLSTAVNSSNRLLIFSHYPVKQTLSKDFKANPEEIVRSFEAPWNTKLKFSLHEDAIQQWAKLTGTPIPNDLEHVPDITILGPRDSIAASRKIRVIDVTSRSSEAWSKELSPFFLGPVPLYDGMQSQRMENGWQYAKVHAHHLDAGGEPNEEYKTWSKAGWASRRAERYPSGKGAKPEYLYWDGKKLDYLDARLEVYWPMYRDAVKKTEAFARLQELASKEPIALWDFDGFNHCAQGMQLSSVITNTKRPMGHAFVLKAMLLHGPDVTPEQVLGKKKPAPR